MDREIKFRGYSTNLKKWMFGTYYHGVMYPTSFKGHYVDDELINDGTIGQFTGLKDKNGNEIYEGDIVAVDRSEGDWECEVKWNAAAAGFYLLNGKYYRDILSCAQSWNEERHSLDRVTVLGNIYENPELLKKA